MSRVAGLVLLTALLLVIPSLSRAQIGGGGSVQDMSKHNYVTGRGGGEPNVHITPDKKWGARSLDTEPLSRKVGDHKHEAAKTACYTRLLCRIASSWVVRSCSAASSRRR